MILGLILGFGIGLMVGFWFGGFVTKKLYKNLINNYKNRVSYWFNSFIQVNKQRHEWHLKYLREICNEKE